MSNQDYTTLTNGEVPTYYRVSYHDDGRARIAYWWFYGWQEECMDISCVGAEDGAHHGDWEHILVTTTTDRAAIEYVTYFFHGDWYTRQIGSFELVGERPVVYVGKLAHGSYHSQDCSGFGAGTPFQCCELADYRESIKEPLWETHLNLVNLDGDSESWLLADRIGSEYMIDGQAYTITGWKWGPLHAWCAYCILSTSLCVDWEHNTACGTHPTTETIDWTLKSCDGDAGCGILKSECDYDFLGGCDYDHNQSWPWDQ
jgi:hypothetical protein